MTAYDDEKTNLKSLFGDNKYPTGANFSELINLPDYRLAENNNGTITVNGITYDMTKTDLGSITMVSADFDTLPNGLSFVAFGQTNAPESTSAYWVRTLSSSAYGGRKLQVAKADVTNSCYFRTNSNNTWNSWETIATQTMLNNKVTDNKDGSITVNGSTFVPADNSKVAHLSGANNFDTVPTVNNNPVTTTSQLSNVIPQQIDPNADLFAIKQAGVYKSVWGNQNTLKNFPSGDGSATIIYSGSGDTVSGMIITVIDSWGNVFISRWQGAASTPGYSPWKDITNIASLQQSSSNNEDSSLSDSTTETTGFYYWTE